MTRITIPWALPALLCASCLVPGTTTYLGFTTDVVDAPPPPSVVVVSEPAGAVVEGGVYVVTDPSVGYDMFRYGSGWFVYSGGYWYRSPSYRGPYAVVDVRTVPRPVLTLPPHRWRHPREQARAPAWGHDRGRGRGHDRDGD